MNRSLLAFACVALSCVTGCGGGIESVEVDRHVDLDLAEGGGFDHWGTPGAALGYSTDANQRLMLVVALKFSLPVYSVTLAPQSAPTQTLREYDVKPPNSAIVDDVGRLPLLASAITDTDGIRSLSGSKTIAAFLLEGDFQAPVPERTWVAFGGEVTLTREEDYYDYLDGSLQFQEVSSLGDSARVLDDGETLGLEGFAMNWNTAVQP
jgi:hypothetical protein